MQHRRVTIRRALLIAALSLAAALFIVDRYGAYAHRPSADATRVAIYTTEWCPYCARLRADLAASGVPYIEYDVEYSLQGAIGFWALRGRGVPVSAIGPQVVYGYRIEQIQPALLALGYSYRPAAASASNASREGTALVSSPH